MVRKFLQIITKLENATTTTKRMLIETVAPPPPFKQEIGLFDCTQLQKVAEGHRRRLLYHNDGHKIMAYIQYDLKKRKGLNQKLNCIFPLPFSKNSLGCKLECFR